MAKVRKADGSIVETVLQGTDGQPLPAPTTPAGAATQGQSPDQAKMAGTPAQKTPILREAVKPQDALQAQQRLTPPAPNATPADQQAQAKVGVLSKLGSYGTALATAVANKLAAPTATAGTPALAPNTDAIALKFPNDKAKQDAVSAAVAAYLTAKTPGALQAVATAMGSATMPDAATLQSLITTPQQAVEGALKATDAAAPTIGNLDLSSLGLGADPLAEIAGALGLSREAAAALSPDALQQAVQDVTAREFSSVQALKAEYRTASPNRKTQILAELRAADATGRSGTELAAQSLNEKLESQETVKIGDKEYSLSDIFSDDGMSDLVLNAVGSPDALAELKTLSPGLATWIETNLTELQDLAASIGEAGRTATEAETAAQATADKLGITADPELQAAFGLPEGPLTPAQAAAWQAEVESNPLWQAAVADPLLMNALKDDPTLVAEWKDLPAATIKTLLSTKGTYDAATAETKALLETFGLAPGASGHFSTSVEAKQARDMMALLGEYKAHLPALQEILGPMREANPAKFATWSKPGNLKTILRSMQTLETVRTRTSTDGLAAFKSLLGLGAGATYVQPGTKDADGNPIDFAALANAFTAALPKIGADNHAGLFALIKSGDLDTVSDLTIVAEKPELVGRMVQSRQEAAQLAKIERRIAGGSWDAARNLLAQQLGIPSWAALSQAYVNAEALSRQVAKSPGKTRALEFMAMLKKAGLDVDGNGRVDQSDMNTLFPTDDKDTPLSMGARNTAAMRKLFDAVKTVGVGDETSDSILGGKDKPSAYPAWPKDFPWGKSSTYFNDPKAKRTVLDDATDALAGASSFSDSTEETGRVWKATGNYKTTTQNVNGKPKPLVQYEYKEEITYKDGHKANGSTRWQSGTLTNGKWQATPPDDEFDLEAGVTGALNGPPVPRF